MFNEMIPFLTAILAGFLIGFERERAKNKNSKPISGARTFPLLALTGAIIAFLGNDILIIIISLFVGILILISHVYWNKAKSTWQVGSTTAVAAMLTFLLGFLAYSHSQLAIILAVILFGFLTLKKRLHSFAQNGITKEEMTAVLTFLISAIVILPLLPNEFIDPWELIHPTRIWMLFVVIAGVEFSSYIALKQLGLKWGLLATGFFGGFISATATTFNLAGKYNERPNQLINITSGIILAEVASLLIQVIVLIIIAPSVASNLVMFLAIPAIIGLLCTMGLGAIKKDSTETEEITVKINNPISLKKTVSFALLISIGLVFIALATRLFGDTGVYLTSLLGGAVSLRVVTFTVSELASSGEILLSTASISILIAMTVNMIIKLGIIFKVGGVKLFSYCLFFFLVMLCSSVAFYFIDMDLFMPQA